MVTLKDIAKKSGVSQSTVSRVLKNDNSLKTADTTRKRILAAAKDMGYIKKIEEKGICIAIVNGYTNEQDLVDPHYYSIRKAVEVKCMAAGYSFDNYFHERKIDSLYDGIIAIGKFGEKSAEYFKKFSSNIVFVDSNPNTNEYSSVEVDYKKMVDNIIDYAKELNVKSIAYLTGTNFGDNAKFEDPRVKYIKEGATNILKAKCQIVEDSFSIESGYKMFVRLPTMPELVICGDDLIAIGVNKGCSDKRCVVGEEVKIIGTNDIPAMKYTVPEMSSIKVFHDEMAYEAVELLKLKIEDLVRVEKVIIIPSQIKKRFSTENKLID